MTESLGNVEIDSLAYNGYGVGRRDGKVVFIPLTAPGDVVEFRILREKPKLIFGEMTRLLVSAPGRRRPPCPVFGQCGGCHWQHLPYPLQAAWKERIFRDTLQRQAGITEEIFHPVAKAPQEWGYRARMQFKCRQVEGRFLAGFYRGQSHFVIGVTDCPLADPAINAALERWRRCLAETPFADRIPQLDISTDEEGKVRVVIHHLLPNGKELEKWVRRQAEEEEGVSLFLQSGRNHSLRCIRGDSELAIFPLFSQERLRLGYGAGSFSQVNAAQNRALVEEVMALAALTGKERVLDLFCGVGNLTLPLALGAQKVVGIESNHGAVAAARRNAAQNGLDNVVFQEGDADRGMDALAPEGEIAVAVLDPPREGAFHAVKSLLRLQPQRILYVSCNPATLARDLLPLVHGGYRVFHARAFDFFPQTFHIEGLVALERS